MWWFKPGAIRKFDRTRRSLIVGEWLHFLKLPTYLAGRSRLLSLHSRSGVIAPLRPQRPSVQPQLCWDVQTHTPTCSTSVSTSQYFKTAKPPINVSGNCILPRKLLGSHLFTVLLFVFEICFRPDAPTQEVTHKRQRVISRIRRASAAQAPPTANPGGCRGEGRRRVQFHGPQFVTLLTWLSMDLEHKHLKVAACKHSYYGFDIILIRATRKTT